MISIKLYPQSVKTIDQIMAIQRPIPKPTEVCLACLLFVVLN